ncbi:MAG: D-glycero-beta-D-manno-heptose 1,7-bisphosphate 7-phosphatase [Caldilineales bacterium]|nr:D-glycero-beta-D-manno-heptose 1,7-bisphosphate 7-phosphatase [Caldilineales bacterium]MDW8318010.1 D-glycero-beta-D-manno-heptose 1,7-bisphosphate 7-phosphatase [Anaerolineae bacterium]
MGDAPLGRAVFLDRDGVIVVNHTDYVRSWEQVQFLPGALDALRRLAGTPLAVVVVTNQSAVGRGLMSLDQMWAINAGIAATVSVQGGRLDRVYACPHRPDEGCACRKPAPGMLLAAAADMGLDLSRSYLVGDAVSDVEAAMAVGAQPILVLTGRGEAQRAGLRAKGYDVPVVADLAEAVAWILARETGDGDRQSADGVG